MYKQFETALIFSLDTCSLDIFSRFPSYPTTETTMNKSTVAHMLLYPNIVPVAQPERSRCQGTAWAHNVCE